MRNTREEREDLARRKEQWVRRAERGEDPKRVRRELKLKLKPRALERLKQRYRAGGRKWQALLERRPGVATKGTPAVRAFLAKAKARNPRLTGAELCVQVCERFEIEISLGPLEALLREAGLSNPPGRPRKAPSVSRDPTRAVDHAGAFFPSGRAHGTGRTWRRAKRA